MQSTFEVRQYNESMLTFWQINIPKDIQGQDIMEEMSSSTNPKDYAKVVLYRLLG